MESGTNRIAENVSIPKISVPPSVDLRSSRKKNVTSFSRDSAARASLGTLSYDWMDSAERMNAELVADAQSSTTWPRSKKSALFANDDFMLEYDRTLVKKSRPIQCEGCVNLERTGYLFQAIFDTVIKRYWGLRILQVDSSLQNQIPLRPNQIIVGVNEKSLYYKSRDLLMSTLVDAFSKPQSIRITTLKEEDIICSIHRPDTFSFDKGSSTTRPLSNLSTSSPVSYIKNLNAFNTRSIGQKITVDLQKLSEGGFGISFATRDTVVNAEEVQPVFVERIMTTGAAIQDGRLQFGDRLLSINGVQVTNFKDAMATLRAVPVGGKVFLAFSRQDSVVIATSPSHTPHLNDRLNDPTSIRASSLIPDSASETPLCQTMIFEIPVPHPDSRISSLGIRFEVWTEPRIIHPFSEFSGSDSSIDRMVGDTDSLEENLSGLFVKNISAGSPATHSQTSGCIRPGDRLVAVNGLSVIYLSPRVSSFWPQIAITYSLLQEISAKLRAAIRGALEREALNSKQACIKLTVNRFFHRTDKVDSLPKSKSILRSTAEASLEKLVVPTKSGGEPWTGKAATLPAEEDSQIQPQVRSPRLERTLSVNLRGRSRRGGHEASSPSDSPERCQSAFTRDGVGRRSVSEKRHAYLSALNFSHYNESILPQCKGDKEASRLYATMPVPRKIRQILRARQGRSSGPVKPVHAEEAEQPSGSTQVAASPEGYPPVISDRRGNDAEFPRTEAGLFRPRSQNHSFRAAVKPKCRHQSPPPTPSKDVADFDSVDDVHRAVTPPIPPRRSKVDPPNRDATGTGSTPAPTHPSSSPSPTPSPSAVQHTLVEDLVQIPRGDRKDVSCFSSSRRASTGSSEEEGDPTDSRSRNPRDYAKPVVLTGVRALPSELRKTPSPVDFNAYAVEQKTAPHFPYSAGAKPPSNFLGEVETCLPKRRAGQMSDTLQVKEKSYTNSTSVGAYFRRNLIESPLPNVSHDYASVSKTIACKNDVPYPNHFHHAICADRSGEEKDDSKTRLLWSSTHTQGGAVKAHSPHAVLRSRSPPIACSGRPRHTSYSLNRPEGMPTDLQRRNNLKKKADGRKYF